MKTAEGVRKCAVGQGLAEKEATKKGMEEKLKKFTKEGAESHAKV